MYASAVWRGTGTSASSLPSDAAASRFIDDRRYNLRATWSVHDVVAFRPTSWSPASHRDGRAGPIRSAVPAVSSTACAGISKFAVSALDEHNPVRTWRPERLLA